MWLIGYLKYLKTSPSVLKAKIEDEVPVKHAVSHALLTDLMTELGIDTPRRYISDDVSSWHIKIHFPEVYCVDKVLSLENSVETHSWECAGRGCVMTSCEGSSCEDLVVTVLNEHLEDQNLPVNCGDAVKITIPKTGDKLLDFDYLGVSEIVVVGKLYEAPTPTSISELDNLCLDVGMYCYQKR